MLTLQTPILSCKTLFFLAFTASSCHFLVLVAASFLNFSWEIFIHQISLFFEYSNITNNLWIPFVPRGRLPTILLLWSWLTYYWVRYPAVSWGVLSLLIVWKFALPPPCVGSLCYCHVYSLIWSTFSSSFCKCRNYVWMPTCLHLLLYLTLNLSRWKSLFHKYLMNSFAVL